MTTHDAIDRWKIEASEKQRQVSDWIKSGSYTNALKPIELSKTLEFLKDLAAIKESELQGKGPG